MAAQEVVSETAPQTRSHIGFHAVFSATDKDLHSQNETSGLVDESTKSDRSVIQNHFSILIVDDDGPLTRFLSETFNEQFEDVTVHIANDGFDAGIKIRELMPEVVLVDLVMPGLGGLELCENIKSSPDTAHIRVIAMTGYSSDEYKKQVIAAGAEACLSKPFQSNDLFELLGLARGK